MSLIEQIFGGSIKIFRRTRDVVTVICRMWVNRGFRRAKNPLIIDTVATCIFTVFSLSKSIYLHVYLLEVGAHAIHVQIEFCMFCQNSIKAGSKIRQMLSFEWYNLFCLATLFKKIGMCSPFCRNKSQDTLFTKKLNIKK